MSQFIKYFPKPLLEDLVAGRWLPVVGAGMSRNAVVGSGKQVPLWDDLGRELAEELQDYPYSGPLDAISAYGHEFGRPRLVERVGEALFINEARPGEAHKAFCAVLFDIVCTTNLDFLLERGYEGTPRYCRPIVDEGHLAINARSSSTVLLKLHGDVHHPTRLVLTEEDYDCFLDRYPLLATYLSNLLITRTAVLVGYSLDDPDFRQVWQVVGERLGKARRLAYAILVDARSTDIARFARRGVRVINLPGSKAKNGQILGSAFTELRLYMQTHLIGASHVTEEEPLTEFRLPPEAPTRLCYFGIPIEMQPQYRDQVFPLVEGAGLVPVTARDVIAPGDNYGAKIDAIMRRSLAAIIDTGSENTLMELGMLLGLESRPRILVVVEKKAVVPLRAAKLGVARRDDRPIADQPEFLSAVEGWLRALAKAIRPALEDEPMRLLRAREYRAAVISAITYLESLLRSVLDREERLPGRAYSLGPLSELAHTRGILLPDEYRRVRDWMRTRNIVVHTPEPISRSRATEIVKGVMEIAQRIRPLYGNQA